MKKAKINNSKNIPKAFSNKDSLACKALIFIILGTFLIIGLFTLRQYGSPWDEHEEITIFIGNVKEYVRLFGGEGSEYLKLSESIDYATDNVNIDHGSSIYYILMPFTKMFLNGNELGFVYLWRTVILLICIAGAAFLYLLVNFFTDDRRLGALASLLLLLSPRFFAESTYNHKDWAQMTLWLALMYFTVKWIQKREWKYAVLLGVVAGFAINMRFAAAMGYFACGAVYCVAIFTDKDKTRLKQEIFQGILCISVCLVVLFVLTPGCWKGLIRYIIYCLTQATSFPWGGQIWFAGELYPATTLTRWYLPWSIAITIPLLIVPLFIWGNITCAVDLKKDETTGKRRIYCKMNIYKALLFSMMYLPVLTYIIMEPTIYNSWRHYYFLYGFIIIFAIFGLVNLLKMSVKLVRYIAAGAIATQLTALALIIVLTHPYQYAYYNILAGIHPEKRYETDYWGVSGKSALIELIDSEYNGTPLKISGVEQNSASILNKAVFILSDEQENKIEIIDQPMDADYLFVNYTYVHEHRNKNFFEDLNEEDIVVEVHYLSTPLAAIYKIK